MVAIITCKYIYNTKICKAIYYVYIAFIDKCMRSEALLPYLINDSIFYSYIHCLLK